LGRLDKAFSATYRFTLGAGAAGGIEINPRTGRPLNEPERTRVKWVIVPESAVPAVKGQLVRGRF